MHDSPNLTATPGDIVAPARRGVSRRAVVGTAAWVAPTIVVATAVPAFAASGDSLVRVTPSAATFGADQTSTSQALTVSLVNNGAAVEGRVISFTVTATNGGSTDWLTLTPSASTTGADGLASATLNYGTPKPASGSTYLITAVDPSDTSLQVSWTLTYTQSAVTAFSTDFNGLGIGFPAGFTIRIGASTTALGTVVEFGDASYSTVPASPGSTWAANNGNFRNVASANSLPFTATTAQQTAATDRAIAVRPSNNFIGDSGAAFVVRLGPTTGRSGVKATFQFQTVATSSTKTLTFVVDAGVSDGTTFTNRQVATTAPTPLTSGATTQNQLVSADFGSALDNLSGDVYVRVFLVSSAGSGQRPTTAIDDLKVTWV